MIVLMVGLFCYDDDVNNDAHVGYGLFLVTMIDLVSLVAVVIFVLVIATTTMMTTTTS